MFKISIRFVGLICVLFLVISDYSSVVQAQETGVTGTTQYGANIRAEPFDSASILGALPANTTVDLLQRAANTHGRTWYLIPYGDGEGWVAGWLLNISGSANSVPISGMPVVNDHTTIMEPDLTNSWPLPEGDNGTRLLNVRVTDVYTVEWEIAADIWGPDYEQVAWYRLAADVSYFTPDGDEVHLTIPSHLSRFSDLLFVVPGDILTLTLGNPLDPDEWAEWMYAPRERVYEIVEETLPEFAETGDPALLPTFTVYMHDTDQPVIPNNRLILHYTHEIVERVEFVRQEPLNNWPLTEIAIAPGSYVMHVEIVDGWPHGFSRMQELQRGESKVTTPFMFEVAYSDASGGSVMFWMPTVMQRRFDDRVELLIYGYQMSSLSDHPGSLVSSFFGIGRIYNLGISRSDPIRRGRVITLTIGDPSSGGRTADFMAAIGNTVATDDLARFVETGNLEHLSHYVFVDDEYRDQFPTVIIPLYLDW